MHFRNIWVCYITQPALRSYLSPPDGDPMDSRGSLVNWSFFSSRINIVPSSPGYLCPVHARDGKRTKINPHKSVPSLIGHPPPCANCAEKREPIRQLICVAMGARRCIALGTLKWTGNLMGF